MENVETFGSPLLADVAFNDDGSLKQSGKQNVKFYNKKRLVFRARPLLVKEGNQVFSDEGKPRYQIDPKTGIPFKDAHEELVEMVRIETKGDTNIIDDIADDLRKRQYYRQYKFFREGKIPDGNPIEDFDFLQPSTIMELHMFGIHVLQQVAVMSDMECEQLKDQSGYEIRDIAAQWIKINSPQGQAARTSVLERENARLRMELEQSRSARNVSAQEATSEVLQSEPEEVIPTMELTPEQLNAPRRGRPRRV
jgi:hypothetical protein